MNSTFTIGIISSVYIGYDLLTALDHIADAGYGFVELAAVDGALEHLKQEDLTPENAKKVRRELDRRGLRPNAIAAHTPLVKEGGAERFLPRLQFAADLGAPVCVTACGIASDHSVLNRNMDVLVKEAEKLGVIIALETNADTVLTGVGGLQFVQKWNSPNLGINYDAANAYRGNDGQLDVLADFQNSLMELKHVHIKDLVCVDDIWRFCQPGTGIIDTQGFLNILRTRTAPIGVNLELPFQYRFHSLLSQLYLLDGTERLDVIDRVAREFRNMVTKALL